MGIKGGHRRTLDSFFLFAYDLFLKYFLTTPTTSNKIDKIFKILHKESSEYKKEENMIANYQQLFKF